MSAYLRALLVARTIVAPWNRDCRNLGVPNARRSEDRRRRRCSAGSIDAVDGPGAGANSAAVGRAARGAEDHAAAASGLRDRGFGAASLARRRDRPRAPQQSVDARIVGRTRSPPPTRTARRAARAIRRSTPTSTPRRATETATAVIRRIRRTATTLDRPTRSGSRGVSGGSIDSPQITPTVSFSYLLFDHGARAGTIEAAKQQAIAANLAHNVTIQNVVLQAESTLFSFLAARALRDAQMIAVAGSAADTAAAEARLRVGVGILEDVYQTRTALAQARLQLATFEGNLVTAKRQPRHGARLSGERASSTSRTSSRAIRWRRSPRASTR